MAGRAGAGSDDVNEESGDARSDAVQPWLMIAGACAVASGVFWWNGLGDAAFVAAVLGVVAWFWNQRAAYRKIRDENEDVEDDPADETGGAGGRG